jgi:hypothetical protein
MCFVLLSFAVGISFAQERQCEWTNVTRIVAVGDVHGDCDQFVKCLMASHVIDASNRWTAGKSHLVQVGDVFDRGPDSKKAMDILMDLEQQAQEAGGYVHALLGNHEAMILAGDYRYLHDDEVEPYGGMDEFKKSMTAEGKYGNWIRKHNAIIKINDMLFVHAGISSNYTAMPIQEINTKIAESLGTYGGVAGDPLGPLWYRGLALDNEVKVAELLAPMFKKNEVKHIVLGHTVTYPKLCIQTRAGGMVILIDVGMSKTYRGGPAMCLVVKGGEFYAVSEEESLHIPVK